MRKICAQSAFSIACTLRVRPSTRHVVRRAPGPRFIEKCTLWIFGMTLHSFEGILSPPTNREAVLSNLNPIWVQLGALLRWEVYNLWRHRGWVQALCHVAQFGSHQGNHKRSEELKWWLMVHFLEVNVWTLLHRLLISPNQYLVLVLVNTFHHIPISYGLFPKCVT